ncbi:hypothetical protein [Streptomyces meridianus]|uniref:Uncharacterized protein n=1 Tax=Streptomyces meridianus TaxID=2938945 RepID=A0ABT0X7B0_9ACTN|nr:hypothetical protein [Streptomyces meridianus]MCM2577833.1 hypothetical protein [Streptomyces meridianus]
MTGPEVMEGVREPRTACGFERLGVRAGMAATTDSATVLHVPAAMGGTGRQGRVRAPPVSAPGLPVTASPSGRGHRDPVRD